MDCLSVARCGKACCGMTCCSVGRCGKTCCGNTWCSVCGKACCGKTWCSVGRCGKALFSVCGEAWHGEGGRQWHLCLLIEEQVMCHRFKTSLTNCRINRKCAGFIRGIAMSTVTRIDGACKKVVKIMIKIIVTTFDIRNGFFTRNNDDH